MANGILVPVVDFTGMAEDEFNDWYDFEHIPERLRVPGFLACERWIGADERHLQRGQVNHVRHAAILDRAAQLIQVGDVARDAVESRELVVVEQQP